VSGGKQAAARTKGFGFMHLYARRFTHPSRWVKLAALVAWVWMPLAAWAQTGDVPAYIGSESCRDCHTQEAAAWDGSHHDLAWTPPDAAHVLGDFSDVTFAHKGVTTRFTTQDGQYFIESDGPDGAMTRYPVMGVAGVAPLQQYLLETEPGRVQSFDVVWDVEAQRWYHLYPDQDLPAGDGMHWTGPYKNWNARCAECHATDYSKAYDPVSKTYASTQSEIGVGCEACHGPGAAHRDWALANGTYDPARWQNLSETGLTVDLGAGGETLIQQCATCHSRREPYTEGNPLPGTPFHDAYRLSPLRDGLYHPDGQILEEVYVYGSFLQSRMYAEGVTCMDCHTPHSAVLKSEGNGLCTQCHSLAGNPRFATLPLAEYDDPAHHFHPSGSDGAQCKSCHMIERDYMGIDGRRDHSFRVPRPDLSVETGSPNACSDCHADKTAAWAAETVAAWYPDSRHRGAHFAQVFAPARGDPRGQIEGLIGIAQYAALPAIVRATALDMLAQVTSPAIADQTETALADLDPMVRTAAIAVQRGAAEPTRASRLVTLLDDPSRSVRMAAAREFLGLQIARMPAGVNESLSRAFGEWQGALRAKVDFPEAQIVLAGIGLTTRRMDVALSAFSEAVTMDPQLEQAWIMMVRIHLALEDRQAALVTAERAIQANPQSIELSLLRADLLR
jgi:predicted CXXCH cytochrome family protein